MLHTECPSCGDEHTEKFFSIKNAPISSVVTFTSKEDALAVPVKNIELAFCNKCGFIFNRLFDDNVEYFTKGYEDQQGFSETFMGYLTKISVDMIEKYHLNGKTLMEIGCGKGDFIDLLVKLNGGSGVGIDPAYEEGRQHNSNVTFFKEYFSPKHGKIPADFICCRHTLEHIHGTKKFLHLVRESLDPIVNPVVVFEVPQIRRILEIQAFWDIYYEHCSYYSPGALARVFRGAGYEILDLHLEYNDQYLLVETRPFPSGSDVVFDIEESVEELKRLTKDFEVKVEKQLLEWRRRLIELKRHSRKTVIWGGGSKSVGFLTHFGDLDLIDYVVDINPYIEGNFIPGAGAKYVQPDFLKDYQPEAVIIMNDIYRKEIAESLNEIELQPEIYAL